MQIDWLTVAAQIVNFLVLVWLLKRFLYQPITNAMRRREEQIEERLEEAKAALDDAEERAQLLEDRRADLDARKDEILEDARAEASTLRERLETDIREEMQDRRRVWRDQLAQERDDFLASLGRQAGTRLLQIAGDVLSEYAGSDLESRVVATFAERLKALDSDTLSKMKEAASGKQAVATLQTGAALDEASKRQTARVLHETLSTDVDVICEEDPEILLGVRLVVGDYSVEWSADRYLRRLEKELGEIIDARSRTSGTTIDDDEGEERKSA